MLICVGHEAVLTRRQSICLPEIFFPIHIKRINTDQVNVYLLCLVCHFTEDVENFAKILEIIVVLGCTKTHEIKVIFLVVKGHVDAELFENVMKGLVTDQVVSPIVQLALALEAEAVKDLRLDIVPLEKLEHAAEQLARVSWVLINASTEAV